MNKKDNEPVILDAKSSDSVENEGPVVLNSNTVPDLEVVTSLVENPSDFGVVAGPTILSEKTTEMKPVIEDSKEVSSDDEPVVVDVQDVNEIPEIEPVIVDSKEVDDSAPKIEAVVDLDKIGEIAEVAPIDVDTKDNTTADNKIDTSHVMEVASIEPINLMPNQPSGDKVVHEENSIVKMVRDKVKNIEDRKNIYGIGKVVSVKEFIVEVVGLEDVTFNEKVNIETKGVGYVIQMRPNRVTIAVLIQNERISVGDSVYQTNELLEGEFSTESFGHVIDMFGNDKLTNKKFSNTMKVPLELETVPIMDRTPVSRPLETGIVGIDLIYPIGKGQRQLIIGDKKTGKTQICLDAIVNQANKNMICIYVAIGKTKKEVKEIYYDLLKRNATDYTIIVTAFYDDMPSIITLTPYFALSIADYYMKSGYDVLVILDDLKKHADTYRQISLMSGKSPGRDAYPADIFYFHSRLLERGCQYKDGGSVTILPVVETKSGDITDYVSTNIISITDGQIVLSRESFVKGEKPAINYGLSVSRLGGSVQEKDMKVLGASVRQTLLSYLETRDVYELANEDEMSKELQEKLFKGKNILNALLQYKYSPLSKEEIIERFTKLDQMTLEDKSGGEGSEATDAQSLDAKEEVTETLGEEPASTEVVQTDAQPVVQEQPTINEVAPVEENK